MAILTVREYHWHGWSYMFKEEHEAQSKISNILIVDCVAFILFELDIIMW